MTTSTTEIARLLVAPRWVVRHLLLGGSLVLCFVAGRWQYHRALARHSVLNWSYTVEWTLFAGFAVLCWGWFLRDELRGPQPDDEQAPAPQATYVPPVTDDEDPELAAYNRMLAELHRKATP